MSAGHGHLNVGDLLEGRYRIVEKIGEGGYGQVFKATQISTGQSVAIKVLHPEITGQASRSARESARFELEMKLIAKLRHPNIVRLIDSGTMPSGALYTALDYIEGENLSRTLARCGPLEPRETKRLMAQVADALCCAHANGVVHRDLKPANIMVTGTGGRRNALVLDFGIASVAKDANGLDFRTLTEEGKFRGTPAYMAPEQLECGEVWPCSDLYAWGLVFLECLVGRPVYALESLFQIAFAKLSSTPIPLPPPLVAHPLGAILAKATTRQAERRYASAQQLLIELEECSVSDLYLDGDLHAALRAQPQPHDGEALAATASQPGHATPRQPRLSGDPLPPSDDLHCAVADTQEAPPSPERPLVSMENATTPCESQEVDWPPPRGPGRLWLTAAVLIATLSGLALALSTRSATSEGAGSEPAQTRVSAPVPRQELEQRKESPPLSGGASQPASQGAYTLIRVPAQRVTIGVEADALAATLREFPDNAFDLDTRTGVARPTVLGLPDLQVMETEVTWAFWAQDAALLDRLNALCPGELPTRGEANFAVGDVSAQEAAAFCAAHGMRLPAAAEWEALARGQADRAYAIQGPMTAERVQALSVRRPVGEHAWSRTPEGIRDLAGGVAEWVTCSATEWGYCSADGYGYRGGSWASGPFWRLAFVVGFRDELPTVAFACARQPDIGFRCVK